MPLTAKGEKIFRAMRKRYGKRGKEVFYRSANAGKITGVHGGHKRKKKRGIGQYAK